MLHACGNQPKNEKAEEAVQLEEGELGAALGDGMLPDEQHADAGKPDERQGRVELGAREGAEREERQGVQQRRHAQGRPFPPSGRKRVEPFPPVHRLIHRRVDDIEPRDPQQRKQP